MRTLNFVVNINQLALAASRVVDARKRLANAVKPQEIALAMRNLHAAEAQHQWLAACVVERHVGDWPMPCLQIA